MLPFDANCHPLAPFDLPYASIQEHWQAQQRWTPDIRVWPFVAGPLWSLSGAGFPGLTEQSSTLNEEQFESEAEALQLAFLQGDTRHSAMAAVEQTIRQLGNIAEHVQALIVSLYGPLSLGLTLTSADEQPLWHQPTSRELLIQHLRLRASWIEEHLGAITPATILCWDEPFWGAVHGPFITNTEAETLAIVAETGQSIQMPQGLAPAGETDWLALLNSHLRFLVCLPAQHQALMQCGRTLNTYFEQGGIIVWGIVPTESPTPTTPADLVETWDQMLKYALERDVLTSRMLSGSLITTTTGLGTRTISNADKVLSLLAETAQAVRVRYKLA